MEKFTKSSGYDSTDRACGLYCLPDSQNKILFVLQCVGLRNELCWGMFCLHWDLHVVLSMTVTRIEDQTADSLKPMFSQPLM